MLLKCPVIEMPLVKVLAEPDGLLDSVSAAAKERLGLRLVNNNIKPRTTYGAGTYSISVLATERTLITNLQALMGF